MRCTNLRIAVALLFAAILIAPGIGAQQTPLKKIAINYPARSGASWAMFLAKEGGYYQKNGLDVTLEFGAANLGVAMIVSGDAQMTNSSMEQALQASSRDPGALVSVGSSLNKGTFALMGAKGIGSIKDLKGKRIAVSQVGDAVYNYTIALLGKAGLKPTDVSWLPGGTDATARATTLIGGRADATLLTAPSYFEVEKQGFKVLANLADYSDIYASTVYLFTRKTVAANPKLPEMIIKAHAEAIKRFYDDKAFAVKAFMVYDKTAKPADVDRIYTLYAKNKAFERIPYVLAPAVKSVIDQANEQAATQVRNFDFRTVIDNSIIDRLVKEGYFEKTFGAGIKSEQESRSKLAVR